MNPMQDRAVILVSEQIGATQSLTPEGFLLCQDVRIARVGTMDYAPHEVPEIPPGGLGRVVLMRDEETLFADSTIASFAGKPVTNNHPPQFVSPDTYKKFTVGTVLEPRRGEGVNDGYLVADLLIMDAKTIADVRSGKREVSCGYDCDREQIKPGLGRQTGIVGNHVALVTKGRAGPACAIQDSKGTPMAKKPSIVQRIRAAFTQQDRDGLEAELDEVKELLDDGDDEEGKKETSDAAALKSVMDAALSDALSPLADRLTALETRLNDADAEEEKTEDEDEEAKAETEDEDEESAETTDSWPDAISRAEILCPGIKIPTQDAKGATVGALLTLQRTALEKAFADPKRTAHVVMALGPKPDFAKLTKDAAAVAFRVASELAKAANNAPKALPTFQQHQSTGMTPAKLQELNAAKRAKLS